MSIRLMSRVFESDLPTTEKFVLLAMADYASDSGESIFPSVATLSAKTSLTGRGVQKAIQSLLTSGHLVLVKAGGGRLANVYRIDPGKLSEPRSQEELRGEPRSPQGRTTFTAGVNDVHPNHQGSTKEPSTPTKEEIYEMMVVLAEVTTLSIALHRTILAKNAKELLEDERISTDLVRIIYSPGGAWYTKDWRGRLGQKPRLAEIRETIFSFNFEPEQETVIVGDVKARK